MADQANHEFRQLTEEMAWAWRWWACESSIHPFCQVWYEPVGQFCAYTLSRHQTTAERRRDDRFSDPSKMPGPVRPLGQDGSAMSWEALDAKVAEWRVGSTAVAASTPVAAIAEDWRPLPSDEVLVKQRWWLRQEMPARVFEILPRGDDFCYDYAPMAPRLEYRYSLRYLRDIHGNAWQPCTSDGKLLPWSVVEGVVVAVVAPTPAQPVQLKIGDRVVLCKYTTGPLAWNDNRLHYIGRIGTLKGCSDNSELNPAKYVQVAFNKEGTDIVWWSLAGCETAPLLATAEQIVAAFLDGPSAQAAPVPPTFDAAALLRLLPPRSFDILSAQRGAKGGWIVIARELGNASMRDASVLPVGMILNCVDGDGKKTRAAGTRDVAVDLSGWQPGPEWRPYGSLRTVYAKLISANARWLTDRGEIVNINELLNFDPTSRRWRLLGADDNYVAWSLVEGIVQTAAAAPVAAQAQCDKLAPDFNTPVTISFAPAKPAAMIQTRINISDTGDTQMASMTPAPTAPSTTVSRARAAYEAAKIRAPVEWTLDEVHKLVVKWAGSTVKNAAERGIITKWLGEQLATAYGKVMLGALIASPIGIPLAATLMGKREALANRIADEFAARAATVAGVKAFDLAKTVLTKHLPKGAMKLAETIFDKFDAASKREAIDVSEASMGQLSAPVRGNESEVERVCAAAERRDLCRTS